MKITKACPKCKSTNIERLLEETGITYYTCNSCGEKIESFFRRFGNWWISWRFYCGKGESYFADINGMVNAIGGLGVFWLIIFGTKTGGHAWILIFIWLLQKIFVFICGQLEVKSWHLAQRESIYTTQFSPPSVERTRRIRNTELASILTYKKIYGIPLTEEEERAKVEDFLGRSVLDEFGVNKKMVAAEKRKTAGKLRISLIRMLWRKIKRK